MIFFLLVLLSAGLLMFELTALFSTPIPDSYLWWGDESWLMLEFRTQVLTGSFRHPYALGSTLAHGSGSLFGNMWISAAIYGGVAVLFKSANVVMIGRTVTTLLATGLVFALYEMVRKLTGDRMLAIFSILLLISSRSFFFTSHSARYDILSASAICVGIFLLLRTNIASPQRSFLAGLFAAAGALVCIHVSIALLLTGGLAVAIDSKWKPSSIAGYFGGVGVLAAIILFIASLQHNVALSPSGFALNVHDIPALRFYSRSVQFANLAQRLATIRELGFGYIIAFMVSFVAVVMTSVRQRRFTFTRGAWLVLALLFSWLEFESAAPTSYLVYILPVLSIAIALAIQASVPRRLAIALIAIGAIVLVIVAIQDDWRARSNGKKLSLANDEAVSAALSAIEQDTTHPLVLAFTPAVHRVLMDSEVRLMTTQFVEYPESNKPIDSVFREQHVRYVMLYRNSIKPEYMREVQPITDASKRMGVLVWERAGFLTDIGRSYFAKDFSGNDTLQVYRIRD